MKVLLLGGSGATGSLVAKELLGRKIRTRIIVRKHASVPEELTTSPLVEIRRESITEIPDSELPELLENCNCVISCLGHNITLRGMFGHPRNLVADSIRRICAAINRDHRSAVKLILMSTTAYTNAGNSEKNSPVEGLILSILKLLLPPHRDNVHAADHLQKQIGTEHPWIEWVAVRPDTLINESRDENYEVHLSPLRSPVFNAGKVSRINVARFMADLLTSDQLWREWQYRMPVIYNRV